MSLLLLSSLAHADCTSRWTIDEVRRSVAAARAEADTEGAVGIIAGVLDSLACPTQVLREGELTDLFTLGAALAVRVGDTANRERFLTAAAVADLGDAARVDEAVVGKDVAALYRARFSDVHRFEVATSAMSTVFVDGRTVAEGESVGLAAGEHVLQYTERGGVVTEVVELSPGHAPAEIGPEPGAVVSGRSPGRTALGAGLLALGVGSFWAAIQLANDAGARGGDGYVVGAYGCAIGGSALVAGGLAVFVLPSAGGESTAGVGFGHTF